MKHKLFLLVLVILSACQAQENDEINLFLTYIPSVQFAPFYVGIENGYFSDAGIDLQVQYGDEPDGVNLVAADVLKFGIFGGEQVIQARANDRPVVAVYEWFQKFPIGVVVAEDSDIHTAADLAGRRVGIPGRFGVSYSGAVALLASAGLTEADVQLEPIGFNAPEVFCMGAVEASVVYINNEPLQIAERAQAGNCGSVTGLRVIKVADALDLVGNMLVTNEAIVADNPDLVMRMVGAFDLALSQSIRNPAQAMLLSGRHVDSLLTPEETDFFEQLAQQQAEFLATAPDHEAIVESWASLSEQVAAASINETARIQFEVLLSTITLWDAEQLGLIEDVAWQNTQDVLLLMDFIEAPVDLAAAYTNAFLPVHEE